MRINWKVTLFSIVCLGLFVTLGFWQLDREREKVSMLEEQVALSMALPRSPAQLDLRDLAGLTGVPVRSVGSYLEEQIFLLDNRVLNGKVGFEVVLPFEDESGILFLVNRGFVPMGKTRSAVADIPLMRETGSVIGTVYVSAVDDGVTTGPVDLYASPGAGHVIVQMAEPALIEKVSGLNLAPFVVRLQESDPNALPRYWPVTVMSPAKHRGYAVQWFTMAGAVLIAWFVFSFPTLFRKSEDSA